ncbi:hypothetical protein Tco_0760489 [Tanacetum coccineum]
MGCTGVEDLFFRSTVSILLPLALRRPEQAPPSPNHQLHTIYVPFVPEPVYPEFLPVDDEVFPAEEQPMPALTTPTHASTPERYDDDDDDAEEEEHLAPADPAAVAYSADQDPYLAYRVTARMSIRPQAPAPPCRTTPGPLYRSGNESTAGTLPSRRMRSYILSWMMHDMTRALKYPWGDSDQRRQTVISELLKADYRRQRQLVETLKIVKSLKAQMTELQRQQGPAKDPAEPELPEEAGSST